MYILNLSSLVCGEVSVQEFSSDNLLGGVLKIKRLSVCAS